VIHVYSLLVYSLLYFHCLIHCLFTAYSRLPTVYNAYSLSISLLPIRFAYFHCLFISFIHCSYFHCSIYCSIHYRCTPQCDSFIHHWLFTDLYSRIYFTGLFPLLCNSSVFTALFPLFIPSLRLFTAYAHSSIYCLFTDYSLTIHYLSTYLFHCFYSLLLFTALFIRLFYWLSTWLFPFSTIHCFVYRLFPRLFTAPSFTRLLRLIRFKATTAYSLLVYFTRRAPYLLFIHVCLLTISRLFYRLFTAYSYSFIYCLSTRLSTLLHSLLLFTAYSRLFPSFIHCLAHCFIFIILFHWLLLIHHCLSTVCLLPIHRLLFHCLFISSIHCLVLPFYFHLVLFAVEPTAYSLASYSSSLFCRLFISLFIVYFTDYFTALIHVLFYCCSISMFYVLLLFTVYSHSIFHRLFHFVSGALFIVYHCCFIHCLFHCLSTRLCIRSLFIDYSLDYFSTFIHWFIYCSMYSFILLRLFTALFTALFIVGSPFISLLIYFHCSIHRRRCLLRVFPVSLLYFHCLFTVYFHSFIHCLFTAHCLFHFVYSLRLFPRLFTALFLAYSLQGLFTRRIFTLAYIHCSTAYSTALFTAHIHCLFTAYSSSLYSLPIHCLYSLALFTGSIHCLYSLRLFTVIHLFTALFISLYSLPIHSFIHVPRLFTAYSPSIHRHLLPIHCFEYAPTASYSPLIFDCSIHRSYSLPIRLVPLSVLFHCSIHCFIRFLFPIAYSLLYFTDYSLLLFIDSFIRLFFTVCVIAHRLFTFLFIALHVYSLLLYSTDDIADSTFMYSFVLSQFYSSCRELTAYSLFIHFACLYSIHSLIHFTVYSIVLFTDSVTLRFYAPAYVIVSVSTALHVCLLFAGLSISLSIAYSLSVWLTRLIRPCSIHLPIYCSM
jgi:hypothetical protein